MKMPCNLEAERQVAGYLLVERDEIPYIFSTLKEEHFYDEKYRNLFKAAREMFDQGESISAPVLADKFNPTWLAELMNNACMSYQVETLCKSIRKKAAHRRLVSVLNSYREEITTTDEPETVASRLSGELAGILLDGRPGFVTNDELMDRVLDSIELRMQGKGTTGIGTGFPDLDKLTGGWQRQHLVFLGAVPKMGKTASATGFLINVARQGYSGLYFSLEMSLEEMGDRQVSSCSGVENTSLRLGRLDGERFQRIVDVAGELSGMKIGWVDRAGFTVTEVKAICRQYQMKYGLDFVVIDQLDKLECRVYPGENQTDAIKRNVTALKMMAQEFNCTVLCLCQLLDKVVSVRAVPRPQAGDEKGSSAPSEDADIVMFMWRPEFYWPGRYAGMAELIISRQRTGPSGSIWLTWKPSITKFYSMPREDWPRGVGSTGEVKV